MSQLEAYEKIRKGLGLIHLYTGDGKGKTTAAVGLAVRARARGLRVLFVQFLKDGQSAELEAMRQLGIRVFSGQPTSKFVFQMDEEEKKATRLANCRRFGEVRDLVFQGEADLLILDEILGAITTGMVDEGVVVDLMKTKPPKLELVLTGRDPSPVLVELSDYVSEVKMIKHPYETDQTPARPGIEY